MSYVVHALLNGAQARHIIEDIDKTATFYATELMKMGEPEGEAKIHGAELIGHAPDEDLLHMAAEIPGKHPKKTPVNYHWVAEHPLAKVGKRPKGMRYGPRRVVEIR